MGEMAVNVKVKRLARRCNPFGQSPWGVQVRRIDVRRAIGEGRFEAKPGSENHAARIAYLVKNGWKDAIEVDVGVPVMGYHVHWLVTDGNHRLAAAIFLGMEPTEVFVAAKLHYARRVLGVDCEERKELSGVA